MDYNDPAWRRAMWGLLSTEFYFYDEGWLPRFPFHLWIVELVINVYQNIPEAWSPHEEFLMQFASPHPSTLKFS